jgi:NADPH-dependent 2,4-dienoyl-CoA reductase/sulfur reductase-like enzyme
VGKVAETVELAIIGAGPAGLSAALAARSCNVQAVILDDQPRQGGQVFRRGAKGAMPLPRFASAIAGVYADPVAAGIDYRPQHAVWAFEADTLHVCGPDGTYRLKAQRTIIATGASEWVLPVPGWTLPGVTTAGGAQVLLKTSGVAVGRRVAIAGTGPLLLQLASQLLAAGVSIAGIFEIASFQRWVSTAGRTLLYPPLALQGIALLAALIRRGVVVKFGHVVTRIHGDERVSGLEVACARTSKTVRVEADAVCLSHGLLPSTELAAMRGCQLRYVPEAGHWEVIRDSAMRTTESDVFAAGDGAGIGGARYALLEGTLAGLAAARDLGRVPSGDAAASERRARHRFRRLPAVRGFLRRTFRPQPELIAALAPETVLCRCEEVRVGAARSAIREGLRSLHELRILLRVGMGPCQGRYCTASALRLLAQESGRTPQDLGPGSPRPPVRPIFVGQA